MTSDFDILNVGRDEWKGQDLLMGFWKKKKPLTKKAIFGPKMADHHILDLLRESFLSILHSESGQEVHENYINSFSNKILVQCKWATVDIKMADPNSGSTLSIVSVAQWNRSRGTWKLY